MLAIAGADDRAQRATGPACCETSAGPAAAPPGKAAEFEPAIRLGVDRAGRLPGREAQFLFGAAFEYGEVRSWVHNLVFTTPVDLTGPRNFLRRCDVCCLPRVT